MQPFLALLSISFLDGVACACGQIFVDCADALRTGNPVVNDKVD
jgi:hypothetical protein